MGNQDQIASAQGYGIEENTGQRPDEGTARSNFRFGTKTGSDAGDILGQNPH